MYDIVTHNEEVQVKREVLVVELVAVELNVAKLDVVKHDAVELDVVKVADVELSVVELAVEVDTLSVGNNLQTWMSVLWFMFSKSTGK